MFEQVLFHRIGPDRRRDVCIRGRLFMQVAAIDNSDRIGVPKANEMSSKSVALPLRYVQIRKDQSANLGDLAAPDV